MTRKEAKELEKKAQEKINSIFRKCDDQKEFDFELNQLTLKLELLEDWIQYATGKAKVNYYIWILSLRKIIGHLTQVDCSACDWN